LLENGRSAKSNFPIPAMNRPTNKLGLVLIGIVCLARVSALAAADAIVPDLQKISQGVGAKVVDRTKLKWEADAKGKPALFANTVVWLDGINFTEGTIECDILGKSAPRGSNFPAIMFHGMDDTTFDCVYFRPFNFRAPNPENSSHAVQYISHPQWTWQKLRSEKTGQYEKPIVPPPDGDAWFRAKIVVEGKTVSVFVNDAAKPSLVVEKLHDRTGGKVAISGGDAGQGGHFANLKITPKKN
jgi:hypothetical protein